MEDEPIVEGLAALSQALTQAERELKQMPFFVRPMIKSGFRKRAGQSLDQWRSLAQELHQAAGRGEDLLARRPGLPDELELLAENFRKTPEVAAKFMKNPETLAAVRERSSDREAIVRRIIEAL